ncbi:unnamed protein product [Taenia asiatica]|uniref:Ovule protein n=1 Tax=Taenia asiatica TaxID=60517 RepID=A0A0R3VTB0_TAEAS|nr:unnamed protein product [Taenia asiatica]
MLRPRVLMFSLYQSSPPRTCIRKKVRRWEVDGRTSDFHTSLIVIVFSMSDPSTSPPCTISSIRPLFTPQSHLTHIDIFYYTIHICRHIFTCERSHPPPFTSCSFASSHTLKSSDFKPGVCMYVCVCVCVCV